MLHGYSYNITYLDGVSGSLIKPLVIQKLYMCNASKSLYTNVFRVFLPLSRPENSCRAATRTDVPIVVSDSGVIGEVNGVCRGGVVDAGPAALLRSGPGRCVGLQQEYPPAPTKARGAPDRCPVFRVGQGGIPSSRRRCEDVSTSSFSCVPSASLATYPTSAVPIVLWQMRKNLRTICFAVTASELGAELSP